MKKILQYLNVEWKIKAVLLLSFFQFCINCSNAQSYYPFPNDSTYWNYEYQSTDPNCPGIILKYNYRIEKDTLINSKIYQVISKTCAYSANGPGCFASCYPNNFNYAYLRNDTINKKLFCQIPSLGINFDTLLYDFSISIGDTLKNCYLLPSQSSVNIVTGIDSIFFDGSYKYGYIISGGINAKYYQMIGLVNTDFFGPIANDINGYHYLNCYVQGDTLNSDYSYIGSSSCPYIYTGVINSTPENCFTFANNITNTENLRISNVCKQNNNWTIRLFNSNGELIKESVMQDQGIEISTKDLKSGFYILEISNLDGKYYRLTKKIILI